jgi:hypothetical protein
MNPPLSVNKDALVVLCVPHGATESIIVNPGHLAGAADSGAPLRGLFEPQSAPRITACWLRRSMRGVPTIER